MRIVLAVLCVNLAACSMLPGSELVPTQRAGAPDAATVRAAVTNEFRVTKLAGNPQVTELRESKGPQPGDWMVCFKSEASEPHERFAVFFRGNEMVKSRRAVVVDQCHAQDYHSLEPELPHWPRM